MQNIDLMWKMPVCVDVVQMEARMTVLLQDIGFAFGLQFLTGRFEN